MAASSQWLRVKHAVLNPSGAQLAGVHSNAALSCRCHTMQAAMVWTEQALTVTVYVLVRDCYDSDGSESS